MNKEEIAALECYYKIAKRVGIVTDLNTAIAFKQGWERCSEYQKTIEREA